MSIAESFVPTFRTHWAGRFVDSCSVFRATGTTFNATTGQTEPTGSVIYADECLVRPASAREVSFGEAVRQQGDYDLYLPYDATVLETGDVVTVTSAQDPEIPVLTVLRGFTDSYLTRRHYECEVFTDG